MESVPRRCRDVGPALVQTIVDHEDGEDTARGILELNTVNLLPSLKERNPLQLRGLCALRDWSSFITTSQLS